MIYDGIFIPSYRPPEDRREPSLWFVFNDDELLVANNGEGIAVPCVPDLSIWQLSVTNECYLGILRGQHCYAGQLETEGNLPEGVFLQKLRPLLDGLPEEHAALAGRAAQLVHWHKTQRYCGTCGERTVDSEVQRAKRCPKCGLTSFPKVEPAVIVAVVRNNTLLLARARHFRKGLYSVLAGFVEPAESLEDCVHREVREEVAIEVENIKYFGSQPWPFPNSLMIAFVAEYAGGTIQVDGCEISHAAWYRADGLPEIPSEASIARRLISWFVESQPRP
jgi:NAD+ diphosphatase